MLRPSVADGAITPECCGEIRHSNPLATPRVPSRCSRIHLWHTVPHMVAVFVVHNVGVAASDDTRDFPPVLDEVQLPRTADPAC